MLIFGLSSSAAQRDTIKVLAIGNSFSEDAVEEHLSPLAQAEGLTLVIGNMYIGGCSLERHVKNLRGNLKKYRYRKFDPKGNKTEIKNYTLEQVLAEEKWDYISIQQVSSLSGKAESYNPWLPELVEYVKVRQPQAELMFHATWAYAPHSTHKAFPDYENDQLKMYKAIISAVYQEVPKVGIKLVIPSGTAIQNARTALGNDLTRDGYHLSRSLGRYIAACTWLEAVLGVNPVGNTYCPEGLTSEQIKIAQKAAHKAVKRPRKITKITPYSIPGPSSATPLRPE